MAELVQGKNEYLYFFIERKLEYVGDDVSIGVGKKFTLAKTPIANRSLDGAAIGGKDIEVYEGDVGRKNLTRIDTANITSVGATSGEVVLANAVTEKKKVYVTYQYEYGHVLYATEYSATTTLDTKDITPVSSSSAEILEVGYKYEGSMKMYDDTDIEDDIMCGVDQSDETLGGVLYKKAPIPSPKHNCITKKVRGTEVRYQVFEGFKMSSLEEATKGGDLREKSFKFSMDDINRDYSPVTGSTLL